jgi:hypothetical protein
MSQNSTWPSSAAEAIVWALDGRPVLPQVAEALRADTPSDHARLAAAVDRQAKLLVTVCRVVTFARALGNEPTLRGQTELPGFEAAFANYHEALWSWADALTPDDVYSLLNEARVDHPATAADMAACAIGRREYLLDRAIYLGLFDIGEGFNPKHAEFFATFAETARRLGDKALFERARQHRHGSTPIPDKKRPGLKYLLLAAWTAGGLWLLKSYDEQTAALRRYWPHLAPFSPEALQKARVRLHLRWPV